jgi:hypothetical protein
MPCRCGNLLTVTGSRYGTGSWSRRRFGKGWDPARIIDYRPGRKTADEIEADVARREVEPKAEPAGMREEDFFGTSRKLHTKEKENQR